MANWIQRFLNAIATHKANAAAHHAKTTSASELTSGVLPSINRLPALTTNKTWKGVGNRPVEVDVPTGWVPTGDGGTKVAAADIEAAAGIPLTKLEGAVCSETELANAIGAHITPSAHHTAITPTQVDAKIAAAVFPRIAEVGDIIELQSDLEKTTSATSYVKVKEIRVARAGAYRIKFDIKAHGSIKSARGKIYKNGVAIGTERTNNSTSYVTMSEDIFNWSAGDFCQLYARSTSGYINGYATGYADLCNFRVSVSVPIDGQAL